CEEHELNSEAVFFCGQCHRQFCNLCNQQHLRFYPTHHTLDHDQRTEWGTVIYAETKPCQKHPKKLGSSLCLDHNVICCLQCSASTHGKCKHLQRLPKKPKPKKPKPTSSLTKEKKRTVSESEITLSTSKTRSNLKVKSGSLKDKSEKSARLARQGQTKAQSESSDVVREYVEGRKPRRENGSDFVQEYVDGKRVTGVYFEESGNAGAVSEFQVSGRRPGQARKNSDIGGIGRNHQYRILSKHVYNVRMDGESPCEIT
ncbi:hypothetical protein MAR_001711, partial [Mya arenaria]